MMRFLPLTRNPQNTKQVSTPEPMVTRVFRGILTGSVAGRRAGISPSNIPLRLLVVYGNMANAYSSRKPARLCFVRPVGDCLFGTLNTSASVATDPKSYLCLDACSFDFPTALERFSLHALLRLSIDCRHFISVRLLGMKQPLVKLIRNLATTGHDRLNQNSMLLDSLALRIADGGDSKVVEFHTHAIGFIAVESESSH
jgi:hypothetical protein